MLVRGFERVPGGDSVSPSAVSASPTLRYFLGDVFDRLLLGELGLFGGGVFSADLAAR